MIAKCGCNCSKCPSYRENLKTFTEREHCSRGWEKYLNIKLKPEKLRLCDGCDVEDEYRNVSYLNCRVRKCAIFNGINNCAFCSEYPCPDVSGLHIIQKPDAREKIEKRMGGIVPEKDYLAFIEPYEGMKHLDEVSKSLSPADIVKMTPIKSKSKVCPFPEDLLVSQKENSLYQQIYDILSTVEMGKNVSFARQMFLEGNRKNLLKLLWAFGLYGETGKDNEYLKLDSEIYSEQKITSYLSRIHGFFRILDRFGLKGEVIPVDEKTWQTPSGALRKKGWYMKLSLKRKEPKGFFKAMKCYTELLDKKFNKKAFGIFSRADMRVLEKNDKIC